jgi:hypothetical protein
MNLQRSGAEKFHGWAKLMGDREPSVRWDPLADAVVLGVRYVPDVHQSNVSHDYEVRLSIEDLAATIATLSTDGVDDAGKAIHAGFSAHLTDLIRLLTCASGHLPVGIRKDVPSEPSIA